MSQMPLTVIEGLLSQKSALKHIQETVREFAGLSLLVLLRSADGVSEVHAAPMHGQVPRFCNVVGASPAGRRRCQTCQALIMLSAWRRGLTGYSCHGGVDTLAMPVTLPNGRASQSLVIKVSCFLRKRRRTTWKAVFHHLQDLSLGKEEAKDAYDSLPVLTAAQVRLVERLLKIAAAIVGEAEESWRNSTSSAVPAPPGRRSLRAFRHVEEELANAVAQRADPQPSISGVTTGSTLIDLIADVVMRNPGMNFSLANLARAVRLSSNHLSMLFHRHYGKPFSTFLSEQRIAMAMRLLADPRLSVGEVAFRSGFGNVSYFCKCFKRKMGVTPGQWRNTSADAASRNQEE